MYTMYFDYVLPSPNYAPSSSKLHILLLKNNPLSEINAACIHMVPGYPRKHE